MSSSAHVLVVDDEQMLRELVSSMLEAEGYRVTLAANAEAGLQAIAAEPPDLVLLDLRMPGMSGWGLIERLRDHPSPPPVIAMSGMGIQEPLEFRAVSRYVYGYLPKPFTLEQLIKTCQRALSAAQANESERQAYAERRKAPRRNLLVAATLLSSEGTPAFMGQILNLSTGGAQLDLGAHLQPGMEVTLSFEIPGGQGPFRVTGRIQWWKDGKLGLAFTNVSAEEQERLGTLLDTGS